MKKIEIYISGEAWEKIIDIKEKIQGLLKEYEYQISASGYNYMNNVYDIEYTREEGDDG
jgi:hypothetical protein